MVMMHTERLERMYHHESKTTGSYQSVGYERDRRFA